MGRGGGRLGQWAVGGFVAVSYKCFRGCRVVRHLHRGGQRLSTVFALYFFPEARRFFLVIEGPSRLPAGPLRPFSF